MIGLGGESWGFFVGYLIPAIMMALAIAVFVLGTPKYRIQKPQGSVLAKSVRVSYTSSIVFITDINMFILLLYRLFMRQYGLNVDRKQV